MKTKQEMAVWLAENVFNEFALVAVEEDKKVWKLIWHDDLDRRNTKFFEVKNDLVAFIYSPDGFSAVWDAMIQKKCPIKASTLKALVNLESFYSAVYEAMEGVVK